MSDHIPFEIQEKIMKRLPVKSLIRFRSVSKAWKSLIDSPQFISAHSVHHCYSHHLLVCYRKRYTTDKTYVSILDVGTFSRQKLDLTVPLPVKRLNGSKVVGSCHGLFCLSGRYVHPGDSLDHNETWNVAVLWNPSIQKAIDINLPNALYSLETVIGFGVCSVTRDPKILLSSFCKSLEFVGRNESLISGQLKVFTLSSGAWQSTTINLPYELTKWSSQAVVDGFIYWLVSSKISVEGVDRMCSLIMSFDLVTYEFKEVHLPERLALKPSLNLSVNKLRDSLAVIDLCFSGRGCDVWILEDGASNLFTKLFTLKLPNAYIKGVLGFNRIGDPILDMQTFSFRNQATLAFYNPVSKRIHYSSLLGSESILSVYSYSESLLLLNQKNSDYCFDIEKHESDDFVLSTMNRLSVE